MKGNRLHERGEVLVYAAHVIEDLSHAMADNPMGPWYYKGIIMDKRYDTPCNHPTIIGYKGHSFLFWHNYDLHCGGNHRRSICVNEFKYNKDGTIPHISKTKSCVLEGVQNLILIIVLSRKPEGKATTDEVNAAIIKGAKVVFSPGKEMLKTLSYSKGG